MTLNHKESLELARLSLEGLAMGDAYGNHHGNNQRKRAAEIWEFSDDTLMAASIFENLRKFGQINQDALAQSFAEHWDGQRGYGKGITRLLKSIRQGADWRDAATSMFDGQGSYGNGAAMRVAPIGAFFADEMSKVVEQAALSATVTHAHPEGIAGAIAVAAATALALHYKNSQLPLNWKTFLEQVTAHVPASKVRSKIVVAISLEGTPKEAATILGNGRPVLAQLTVPFTLWSASHFLDNFEQAILQTASVGGDVDTNCAIVGGIVSMYNEVESIPASWRKRDEPLPDWA